MIKCLNTRLSAVALCLFLYACDNEGINTNIEIPQDYAFERDGQSTVLFDGQTTRIKMGEELLNELQNPSTTVEHLLELYRNADANGQDANPYSETILNESTKSIRSKVAASFDYFNTNTVESISIKNEIESWIESQVKVFNDKDELAKPGQAGQIADGSTVRYISAKGLEYDQIINKSLIGALMVDQMCNNYLSTEILDAGSNRADNDNEVLSEDVLYTEMEHKWDEAYGYLFGLSTDAEAPLQSLEEDSFLNKYLARVDEDPDFNGIAQNIFDAFKLGRAAIVRGDYEIRDQQAEIIKTLISEVIGIRAVYYLQTAKRALQNNQNGTAFHALSEGYGFIYSLRFSRQANSDLPYFSKKEVENFLEIITVGNGFWDVDSNTLDSLSEDIATRFNFTVTQAAE